MAWGDKRAQITLFILMGVVLITLFGLTIYLRNLNIGVDANRETEQITDSLVETTTLRRVVTSCLEESTQEGLLLLGKRGGFLTKDDPYTIISWDIPRATIDNEPVAYGVYAEENSLFHPDRATLDIDNYPCNNQLLVEGAQLLPSPIRDTLLSSYEQHVLTCPTTYDYELARRNNLFTFGRLRDPAQQILPELCKEMIRDERRTFSCECNSQDDPIGCAHSMQAQLEHYVAQRSLACFLDSFESAFSGVDFEVGDVTSNITFSNSNVHALLNLPIRISRGAERATEILEFSTTVPSRIKRIHALLYGGDLPLDFAVPPNLRAVTEEEVRGGLIDEIDDITHNLPDRLQALADDRLPGLQIEQSIISDSSSPSYLDTVLKITDTATRLGEDHFVYQFVIENRRPALDYLSQNRVIEDFDVITSVGETIVLEPLGVDADGDPLTYSYSGWKEDEEECTIDAVANTEVCIEPHEWTTSLLYDSVGCLNPLTGLIDMERCGSYQVTSDDIGIHTTVVSVEDSAGHRDTQSIRILVNDRPSPELRKTGTTCSSTQGAGASGSFPVRQRLADQLDLPFSIDCGDLSGGTYEYEWYTHDTDPLNQLSEADIRCDDPSVRWSGDGRTMVADECSLSCIIRKESPLLLPLGQFPKRSEDHIELLALVRDRFSSEGVSSTLMEVTLYKDFDADGFCFGIDPIADSDPVDTDSSIYPGAPEVCHDLHDNNGDNLVDCEDPTCFGKPSASGEMCCDSNVLDTTVCAATQGSQDFCYACVNNVCTPNTNDCTGACQKCQAGRCVNAYNGLPDTTEHPDFPGLGLCVAPDSCSAGICIDNG